MLTTLENLPSTIVALRASGKVNRADYENVLVPHLEKARQEQTRIRLLLEFSPEFSRLTIGAALNELKIGIKYAALFAKVAVISDSEWFGRALRFFSSLRPSPTRSFRTGQMNQALAWLEDGAMDSRLQLILKESGVAIAHLNGPLRREDFEKLAGGVDPWIDFHHKLQGLVVVMKSFSGWENVGSLLRHLEFVRGHQRRIRKVCIVTDSRLPSLTGRLMRLLVQPEIRSFPSSEILEAERWAEQPC